MSEQPSFGDTLSGGIQEVSALLPLLGTEQCEQHVGTALDKGWLFAAAAPLSIFGSLGIVKTAFATLLATTTGPFYGGRWLSDAGFSTTGSVSSMVTLVKGTKQYGAEAQLQQLLKEQHIDDPELVKEIDWFGWRWRRKNTTDGSNDSIAGGTGSAKFPSSLKLSWNASLILSSMVSSLVAITPYLFLIHNDWGGATLWLFPILRSFGSLLCVVSVQLALQNRIHRITMTSLLIMKVRKRHPVDLDAAIEDRDALLEWRLHILRDEIRDKLRPDADPEKDLPDRDHMAELQRILEAYSLSQNALMFFLRALLVVGMAMIVAGYVGCFNMVGRTEAPNGPYVWFGMETGLAVLRIALWGWNPSWDEGGTGMTMYLALRSRDLTSHPPPVFSDSSRGNFSVPTPTTFPTSSDKADPEKVIADSPFPLITTPQTLSHLTSSVNYTYPWQKEHKQFFIVRNADDFLASATPFVGLLPRLQEERKDILLYYAIIPDVTREKKVLCMTARRVDSQWASVSVLIDGGKSHTDGGMSYTAFTSRSQDFPGTRALKVALENEVQLDSVETIDHRTLNLLIEYSFRLFSRLCTIEESGDQLPLSWNATLLSSLHEAKIGKSIPLTDSDKNYIRTRQIHDLKYNYCLQRGNILFGFSTGKGTEWGLILESAVMEVALCLLDHRFARHISSSPTSYPRRLSLEWILAMEDRISLEKQACRKRWGDPTQARLLSNFEATYDTLARELRSLRHAPTDSSQLQDWEKIITIIVERSDQSTFISEIFQLPPLGSLEHVTDALRPLFIEKDVPTAVYHNMITSLRSSLLRLRDVRGSSLDDHIDSYGPGTPDFDPPYTKIRQVSEETVRALSLGFEEKSIRILDVDLQANGNVLDILRILASPSSSHSLTSVFFRQVAFVDRPLSAWIEEILMSHCGIIGLLLDDCGPVDCTRIDKHIAANRSKWVEEARRGDVFTYKVGCDLNPVNQGDYRAAQVYQHEILLTNRADVFAMIYVPRPGKIVLNLSLRFDTDDIALVATLRRSDSYWEAGLCSDQRSVLFGVVGSGSPGYKSVLVEGFSGLQAGGYKLRISLVKGAQYLYRQLEIKFTERLAGGDSDRKLGGTGSAEGAMIVQEGEEVSGEEGVFLDKTRLGDAVCSGHGPGSPDSIPPYTKIRQVSDEILRALPLMIEATQLLYIDINRWAGGHVPLDILRTLYSDSLPPSSSLTSVFLRQVPLVINEPLRHHITEILKRHRRIICLLLDDYGPVDKSYIDNLIAANRSKWMEEARRGGKFTYIVGYNPVNQGDYRAAYMCQHDILLTKRADVFAMIYIPRLGKIVLDLSLRLHPGDITLVATLTRSDPVGKVDGVNNRHAVPFDVVESRSPEYYTSVSVGNFPELRAGCYELRISLEKGAEYFFRRLEVTFTARSAGEDSDRELGGSGSLAEGAVIAQEGEEVSGEEGGSLDTPRVDDAADLDYGPGSLEFAPPYTRIRRATKETLRALPLIVNSIQMLDIDINLRTRPRAPLDILRTLHSDSLPPSLSLTCIFFHQVILRDKALDTTVKILEKHHGIICLLLDNCYPSFNIDPLYSCIVSNRSRWMKKARSEGLFTYHVGCELNPLNQGDYRAAQVHQHDILLTNRADIFAMIYVPRPGRIVLHLELLLDPDNIALVATLTRSDSIGEVSVFNNGHTIRFYVVNEAHSSDRHYTSVSVKHNLILEEGCYELRISLKKGTQYLFRKLKIDFTEYSAGGDLNRELGGNGLAGGAMVVQEGEEVSKGEGVSLHTPRVDDAADLGYGPGFLDFTPPYTRIRRATEETLRALPLIVKSIQVLDIDINLRARPRAPLDILRTLHSDSLPPSLSLTCIFFHQVMFCGKALDSTLKILEKHHGIICLLFENCHTSFNIDPLYSCIVSNRSRWMKEARTEGLFTYDVGCELNPLNQGDYRAAQVHQHDILLTNRADIFAMIYVPRPGRIILRLLLLLDPDDIVLVATLTRSDSIGEVRAYNNGHAIRFYVVNEDSSNRYYTSVSVKHILELEEGCYELRISLEKGTQYLFRKLEIDFIERSAGGDSDRELSGSGLAEGAMIVQEDEEVGGEEGVFPGIPQLGDAVCSGSEPDTDPMESKGSPQQGGGRTNDTDSENAQRELESSGFEEVIDEASRSRTEAEGKSSQPDDDGVLTSKKEHHSMSMGEGAGDSGSNSAESHHALETSPQPGGTYDNETHGSAQSELVLEGLDRGVVEDGDTSLHPQMKAEDGT
ncbi:hypothetical protein PQX77_019685 [Marasmius sp. AFHP31]|nr:hypothetical protein PQX77_019685 [Marasmius sp. AFHP31]